MEFQVTTDSPDLPSPRFRLAALLTPEVEVERLAESDVAVPLDQAGRQVFRVICRRKGDQGRDAPTELRASEAAPAAFSGAIRREVADDVVIVSRDVEVTLPASSAAGIKRAEMQFRWEGGASQDEAVNWRVVPRIEATPPGLTLRATEGRVSRAFRLSATDQPFRILGIEGTEAIGKARPLDIEPAKAHLLTLEFDAARLGEGIVRDVTIRTDHPHQPTVTLSVLVLGDRREGVR